MTISKKNVEEEEAGQNSADQVAKKKYEEAETGITHIINNYPQGIPLVESILINNKPAFIQIVDGKPKEVFS